MTFFEELQAAATSSHGPSDVDRKAHNDAAVDVVSARRWVAQYDHAHPVVADRCLPAARKALADAEARYAELHALFFPV